MEFSNLAVLLSFAAFFGIIAKRFKQPLLVGYLAAGILASYLGILGDPSSFVGLGKIGVALLLFLVGLEMKVGEIPTIGKAALLTGLGQIFFTFLISFILGTVLGFGFLPSTYIAIAMTFSSTIIIVKLLSEKNDLDSLYGKISVGFLLVQDLVAILILMFLAGIREGGVGLEGYVFLITKAFLLIVIVYFLSKRLLPYIFDNFISLSTELLFIVSIAWALGIASLVAGPFGLSLEIGGFLAGLSLSNLSENLEIASRTRPLRDFFLTIFFLSLGAGLKVEQFQGILFPALIFSILVLVGNPIIVMSVMGFLRFKKRTSFLASVTVAQISEFSLVIMAMGLSLGHVTEVNVALTVLVAVITMTISTYLILGSDRIFLKLKDKLNFFERDIIDEPVFYKDMPMNDHVILVGCGRAGKRLLTLFDKKKVSYLIVDYDPKVYTNLVADKRNVIFGDISDPEIQEATNIESARLLVSTIKDLSDNLTLLEYLGKKHKKPTAVFIAQEKDDAIKLYEQGAPYVIVPEILAGEQLRHILASHGIKGTWFEKTGKGHFNRLLYS